MKTKALIIKEGRVCCTDKEVPEKPIACSVCEHEDILKVCACEIANKKYRDALQLIKDNAVLIREEDQDLSRKLIYNQYDPDNCNLTWCGEKGKRVPGEVSCYNQCSKYKEIKEDTFYPVSVEVEIGDSELCKYCNKSKDGHYHDTVLNRYACKAGDLVAALCTFHPQTVARIVEEPVEKKPEHKEFVLSPVYADNGEHSHYTLIESATGIKVWSEDPEECRAQGYPVNSQVEDQEPKDVIDFATWYSGMEREKVINAYKRYQRESKKP